MSNHRTPRRSARVFAVLAVPMALCGCATAELWHRPASVVERDRVEAGVARVRANGGDFQLWLPATSLPPGWRATFAAARDDEWLVVAPVSAAPDILRRRPGADGADAAAAELGLSPAGIVSLRLRGVDAGEIVCTVRVARAGDASALVRATPSPPLVLQATVADGPSTLGKIVWTPLLVVVDAVSVPVLLLLVPVGAAYGG